MTACEPAHPNIPLAEHGAAAVHHASWQQLISVVRGVGGCDSVIVDAPYSERTHAGHDDGVVQSGRGTGRKLLSYSHWGIEDVNAFVAAWASLTRGWFCTLTDHVLAPAWADALERADRYVFAPLAVVDVGSRVRLAGDGPSNWTVWLIVARPKTREFGRWGTLPGAYIVAPGDRGSRQGRDRSVVGGKPLGLMRKIVSDYTRRGEIVVDPCCGAGTTLLAARLEGRRAIGGDISREHAELAAERIRPLPTQDAGGTIALPWGGR